MKEKQEKESLKIRIKKYLGSVVLCCTVYFLIQYAPDTVRFFYIFFKIN